MRLFSQTILYYIVLFPLSSISFLLYLVPSLLSFSLYPPNFFLLSTPVFLTFLSLPHFLSSHPLYNCLTLCPSSFSHPFPSLISLCYASLHFLFLPSSLTFSLLYISSSFTPFIHKNIDIKICVKKVFEQLRKLSNVVNNFDEN